MGMTREERTKLIKHLKYSRSIGADYLITNKDVDEIIKTLEQEPKTRRWIPVSERLPSRDEYIKNNGLFIVSDGDRSYSEWYDIYDTRRFGEPTMSGFRIDYVVTAWMPLPEPYKAESEQGMNCEDCVYTDIADWEQNEKTGKAKAVYWCKRHKKLCNDIQKCQIEDNGEK